MCIRDRVERGQRVFPQSDRAHDVADALVAALAERGVEVLYKTRAKSLVEKQGRIAAVQCEHGRTISGLSLIHISMCIRDRVKEINLGGGFGIMYTEDDTPLPIVEYMKEAKAGREEVDSAAGKPLPVIGIEPGRRIGGERCV